MQGIDPETVIGEWKVVYMGGIPGFYGIWGKTKLSLTTDGFSLTSDRSGRHFFPYNIVISWNIIKERSSYATANPNAIFKPRHIRIEYLFSDGSPQVLLLEMIQSIFLPTNAKHCQKMIQIMNTYRIFDKFHSV